MKKVYCVFEDYGYEGMQLQNIFHNEADADECISKAKLYQHLIKEVWEVE